MKLETIKKKGQNYYIKYLKRKLDELWSLYVRKRDGYSCVICGSKKKLQNGHLIRRGKWSVRYNEFNQNAKCSRHNFLHNEYPEYYTDWFIKKFGAKKYNELVELSKIKKQFSVSELEAMLEKIKSRILRI